MTECRNAGAAASARSPLAGAAGRRRHVRADHGRAPVDGPVPQPLNTATGLGLGSISLAFAFGQLWWGLTQPFAGSIADRYGAGRVLVARRAAGRRSAPPRAADDDAPPA